MRRPSFSPHNLVLILSLNPRLLCFSCFKCSLLFEEVEREFEDSSIRNSDKVDVSFLLAVFIRNTQYWMEYHKACGSTHLCICAFISCCDTVYSSTVQSSGLSWELFSDAKFVF